jgi:prepilin-type N-terminal cleavage/methylation domain-containing protein
MNRLITRFRARRDDRGFTLVEMLVAVVLMGILGSVFISVLIGAKNSATATRSSQDLNEEARLGLNRMARELRQATVLSSVLNPDGPSYSTSNITALTFSADFNGDGCINGVMPSPTPSPTPTCAANDSSNPEVLTYCWDPSSSVRQLFLIPGTLSGSTCNVSGAKPILAGQVTAFKLSYRSNAYLADSNNDGITTWLELDQEGPPFGNSNGALDSELPEVDSIVIALTVSANGAHVQNYTTQVDLRNLS